MSTVTPIPEVLTPEQAADYLQVNRETIYRYINDGRLIASKLGRSYRIPKRYLELLLLATSTTAGATPRQHSDEEIEAFLREDELDDEALAVVRRIEQVIAASDRR